PAAPPPPWRPGPDAVALVAPAGRRGSALAEWLGAVPLEGADQLSTGTVVGGSPEEWLAHWPLLTAARADADLVVDTAVAGEYRAVTARRELPPYAMPGSGRGWLVRAGEPARRILLGDRL
ncbi:MAG: hypothetical protein ACK5KK_15940, partial [Microbacterium sp.]